MRLFWKIYGVVFISFVAVISFSSYVTSAKRISDTEKSVAEEHRTIGLLIASDIKRSQSELKWPFECLKDLSEYRDFIFWWIVDEDGIIYLAHKASFIGLCSYDYFPHVTSFLPDGNVVLNKQQNYGIFTQSITTGENTWTFWLGFSTKHIAEASRKIILSTVVYSASALVILGFVLYFVIIHFLRPVKNLTIGVKKIGKGELDYRVEVESNDELGYLARSFNKMSDDLKRTTTSIDNLNREATERVKAEEQIRKQNEFLNSVLESLTHPFYVIDANDYTIKMANSALYAGKLSEKTTCYTLTHKRDKPCNGSDDPCPLEEIKKTKRPVIIEHVHYDKDGKPRNVEVHAYPILDDKGNVSEIIEYTLDITERKKAEAELKAERNKLQATMAAMEGGVTIQDREYNIIYQNRFLEERFGGLGEKCYRVYEGKEENCEGCPVEKAFRDGKCHTAERKVVMPNGEIRYWDNTASPIRDATGEILSCVELVKDITERKQVEEEIRDIAKFPSENPNPVLRIQKDGKILYGNDAALPLLALWKSKVGGVVPAKWRRLVDLTFESEKAISNEDEVDGRIFSFVIAPVADNDYANMYASDVTERKQAEVELKAAQEKLIDTAHRAGMAEVAADVLHNVGNVLNSINVSATVIREKVTSSELANLEKVAGIINEHTDDLGTFLTEDPQGKHIPVYLTEVSKCLTNEQTDIIDKLQVLTENVQHIKDIVSMQQDYTKVSGVKVQTSLSKLVEDAIQINSAGLERHGTRLIREFEELGDVEIDKQKALQVLVNLISNAKYALSGCDKEEKFLTIRIYKHGEERLRIEVADNGAGISEDNLTKIFSHGFTTKKQGHGFGLHSSALAAKEMGGTLTVYSDGLGQGATFTLELPFKPVEVIK